MEHLAQPIAEEFPENVKIMKINKKHNGVLDCEKDVYNNYRGRWGL